jgi:hypothetical protein
VIASRTVGEVGKLVKMLIVKVVEAMVESGQ